MRLLMSLLVLLALAGCDRTPLVPQGARVETLANGLNHPWSMAFLPGGDILIVEKFGGLRRIRNGRLDPQPIRGTPAALQENDSGLLDIALDPQFAANQLVYIAFTEGTEQANHTALYRARLNGRALVDGRVIFRVSTDKAGFGHPGGRLLFLPDETLLLTIGDGYDYRDQAQNLASHLGKVVRLTRDGAAPPDNPFVGRPDARPEIYSYGHRNPQGLTRDGSGRVWLLDHGPRGGDEINLLRRGQNYGWPRVTFGIDYDGTLISGQSEAPGTVAPVVVWVPSIAPSGMAVYSGARYAPWTGQHFVGALAARELRRVRIQSGKDMEQERMLTDLEERIRDVREGPDGLLYLLTDSDNGRLLRLHPPGHDEPN